MNSAIFNKKTFAPCRNRPSPSRNVSEHAQSFGEVRQNPDEDVGNVHSRVKNLGERSCFVSAASIRAGINASLER
ncbi:MAG: hypothetical protein QM790_09520 [Nibricoccus sp.]